MGTMRLVPMTAPGIEKKEFGVQHAKNILLQQKNSKVKLWKIIPDSGFTFDGNELKYSPNKRKNKGAEE